MQGILPHLLPASLYAFLGFHFWRTRWTQVASQSPPGHTPLGKAHALAIAACCCTAMCCTAELFGDGVMRFGFSSAALSLMLWLAVLIYWVESFHARLEGLQPLVLPLAGICALLPALFPGQHLVYQRASLMFRLHFFIAMVAYSLFTLAALHAIIMAIAERRLHRGELTRPLASLPPLLTMESLLFRLIAIAFTPSHLTLVSGFAFSETVFGKALDAQSQDAFFNSVVADFRNVLLIGRHVWGWRGRKALRWTMAGFATLLLAYVGSRFVLEVILGRLG
jgi:ABC-type uncharacterized transport system permease subunit